MRSVLCCFLLFSITTWIKTYTPGGQSSWGNSPQTTQEWVSQPKLIARIEQDREAKGFITTFEKEAKKLDKQVLKPAKEGLSRIKKIGDDNKLEKILKEDMQRDGLILGLIGALTLLYDTISDTLLYPVFSFLFFVMTAILIFLVVRLIIKIRRDEFSAVRSLTFYLSLYLFVYADLFMVMYEKRKILFLFLEFQKDIVLVILSALIGFVMGKSISKRVFEEENIP